MQEIKEAKQWDALIAESDASFLQSYAWGEFQKKYSRVYRFAYPRTTSNGISRLAQIEERSLPFGFKMWFVPRGPINGTKQDLQELTALARKAKVVCIRFEPYEQPPLGKRSSPLNPQVTLITDLTKSADELLKEMHAKTRYNIRLAQKKNVTVRESADVQEWLTLHHQTTARDKFKGHSDQYYVNMLSCPLTKLWVAEYTDESGKIHTLAALIAVFHKQTVTYLHGASSNQFREVMAPYALHWQLMEHAKSKGYTRYDWWGINPESRKHPAYKQSWEGITRFKRGFGGTEVEYPGTFEIPVRPFWYTLYALKRTLGL